MEASTHYNSNFEADQDVPCIGRNDPGIALDEETSMAGRSVMETQRLWLREFDEDDAAVYFELASDPRVIRYTGASIITSPDQALEVLRTRPIADYQRYGYGRWACTLKHNGEFVGWAGLKFLEDIGEIDVGYWLLPAYWGRGLATEAASACLRFGFDHLNMQCIIAFVDPENVASVHVLEKIGMSLVGPTEYRGSHCMKYETRASVNGNAV